MGLWPVGLPLGGYGTYALDDFNTLSRRLDAAFPLYSNNIKGGFVGLYGAHMYGSIDFAGYESNHFRLQNYSGYGFPNFPTPKAGQKIFNTWTRQDFTYGGESSWWGDAASGTILAGNRSVQPTASIVGRVYVVSDENSVERDDGLAWGKIATYDSAGLVTSQLTKNMLVGISQSGSFTTDTTALTPQFLRVGIGAAADATVPLIALSAAGAQFQAQYSAAVYTSFTTNSNGYLAITDTGGKVGILGTPTSGKIHFLGTEIAPQTTLYYTYMNPTVSPAGDTGAGVYYGVTVSFLLSDQAIINTGGFAWQSISAQPDIRAQFSGVTYIRNFFSASVFKSTAAGTIAHYRDFDAGGPESYGAGLTITDIAHFYARDSYKGAGTFTNQYGLRVATQTSATNNWAIKTEGGLVEFLGTTEQLRASYSAAVYASHTVASTGVYTITQTGASLALSKAVNVGTSALATGVGDWASGLTASYQVAFAQAAGTLALHSAAASVVHTIHANGETAFNMLHGAGLDFRVAGESLDRLIGTDASAATENLALLADALPNWQTMDRGMFVGEKSTAPNANPAAGYYNWGDDWNGAGTCVPFFRGEDGSIVKLFTGTTIADPSGGVVQDAEARTAINALIDRLQGCGLIA